MRFVSLSALLAGVPLAVGAAGPSRPRSERNTCVADDLLRFLRSQRRDAAPFCRELVGTHEISTATVLVTQTITLTHTSSATVTDTETAVSTSTEIDVSVVTVTITSSTTTPAITVKIRDIPMGGLFAQALASYPADSVSSACSCLTAPMCIKKTTVTALTQTEDHTTTQTTTAVETTTVGTVVTSVETSTTTQVIEPSRYPTQPFRIVSYNATGDKMYFQRGGFISNDVLYQTPDVNLSPTFIIDGDHHLWYNGLDISVPVFAFYSPSSFSDDNAKVIFFNTPTDIETRGNLYHTWTVDFDALSLGLINTVLDLQTCDRIYSGLFMVGNVVENGCTPITLSIEFL